MIYHDIGTVIDKYGPTPVLRSWKYTLTMGCGHSEEVELLCLMNKPEDCYSARLRERWVRIIERGDSEQISRCCRCEEAHRVNP